MELAILNDAKREAYGETYREARPTIERAVRDFVAKFGVDFAEALADADFFFLKACQAPPRGGVSFENHVKYWVYYGLYDQHRTGWRRGGRGGTIYRATDFERVAGEPVPEPAIRDERPEDHWAACLGADAAQVIRLVLDPPPGLPPEEDFRPDRNTPYRTKKRLQKYLRNIGWAADRIAETFRELAEAMG